MDLNGNVIGLVSSTQADRYAVYDYDGYGLCIRANEPEEGLNAVRFSSKYTDVETGLVYYGYRYYSPVMTQWISRDPIGEKGGVNLYGMVGNDVVTRVDYLGKKSVKVAFVFDDRASQSFNNTMFPGNTMPEWEARARSAMADLKEVLDRCNDLGVKIDCSQVYGEWSPLDSADPLGNDQLFGKNPLSGSDLPGGFDSLGNPGKLKTPPPAGIYDALKELNKKIKWPDSHFHVILTGRWTSGLFKVNGMAGRTDNLILLNMSASKWTLPHEMGHVIKWIDAASQKTHSNEKSNLMYTDGSSGQPDCQWCHKLKDYINK
nr:RHS repeat-associated core domain-containing protein [Prosthecobacter dejongeii]